MINSKLMIAVTLIFFGIVETRPAEKPFGKYPYNVVGTGVTACYNNNSVINCPTDPSEPFYGQNQGVTPSYKDNEDGTITDLNTGLMWIKSRGVKLSWDSTFIMAAQCNLGGYMDWRVPTIKELYSLINFNGKSGLTSNQCIPYLDTNYFGWTTGNISLGERVIDAQDWSATKYRGLTMVGDSTIFGVNFVDGRIKGYPQYQPGTGNSLKQKMHIRFVRGNILYGINNLRDNGDSTVTDSATGLMWSKNDSKAGMNWQSALAWVQSKNASGYLGHSDWRLPTAKELESIVDYSRCKSFTNSAAIDPIFNISTIADEGGKTNWPFFWSNTTHLDNNGGVYICFGEALGWMKLPPTATYYTIADVHGAGAQRSDPKSGSYTSYQLGYDQSGNPVYGLGPQGDVIRINNYVRLVRTLSEPSSFNEYGLVNPRTFELLQNYPNPFNPSTQITFQVPITCKITLKIHNSLGQEINTLIDDYRHPGTYKVLLNTGRLNLSSGVYFYTMRAGSYFATKKLILLK
jgi:hypothetical protein